MNNKTNFLIYGSYGYTGKLITQLSIQQGLIPIIGGRNKELLLSQAAALNLEYRVFDLDDKEQVQEILQEFIAVINCAGPFIHTYKHMAEACIQTQTHYIDITGEYKVIEHLNALDEQAKSAGILLLPGAGFDVVPSDCLAQHLKSRMPDANELILAIAGFQEGPSPGVGISRGTAKTMLEGITEGTMIRDQGILKNVPLTWKTRTFDFYQKKPVLCSTVSWGDIASAWYSTGIPHIETYMALPQKMIQLNKFINPIKGIFNWSPIKNFLINKINQLPEGPSLETRRHSVSKLYGEVSNAAGEKMASFITTPNGYDFTALSALTIMKKILAGNSPIGFHTPSTAYTKELVLEIPGVTREDLF